MKHEVDAAAYVGLDIGTGSVGWAVTDQQYHLCRARGKDMWGVRLFEDAQTAQERRAFRIQRRRLQRRNQRLALLQELFAEAIRDVDPGFFQRMSLSRILPEQKNCKYSLFDDEDFTDRTYHRLYPTIYHLRLSLIHDRGTGDPRLVYLAIHHILKNRGHFLMADTDQNQMPEIENLIQQCALAFDDELEMTMRCERVSEFKEVLLNTTIANSAKQKKLQQLFSVETKQQKEWLKLLCGATASLDVLFDDPSFKDDPNCKTNFAKQGFEDELSAYEALLGERMYLLELWRKLYSWAILKRLIGDHHFLSEAKVAQYEQHAEDLAALKHVLRQYGKKEQYDAVFKKTDEKSNYCNLVGHAHTGGKKESVKRCSHADFCKFIKSVLLSLPQNDEVGTLLRKAEEQVLLPRLISRDNSVIPYQIHRAELEIILDHAVRKLPFLAVPDEQQMTAADKIKALLEFRIPYYVGPLNSHSKNSWAVRLEEGKIYPWNLKEKIDLAASAQQFIDRMTGQCTYLSGCSVLPACSPLYERFKVLNEINPITLHGEPISVQTKQMLFECVFMKHKKPTIKTMIHVLEAHGLRVSRDDIGGIDLETGIKSNLRTEILLRDILAEQYTPALAEDIVAALTYLGEDRRLLRKKLQSDLGLSDAVIGALSRIRCTGWGRLSAELLETLRSDVDGYENISIIEAMWATNHTFAGLMAEPYGFGAAIERHNAAQDRQTEKDFIDELYVSPSVKRQIHQTLTIMKELRKIMGHDPEKIFIEMARGSQGVPERKVSRKQRLTALYAKLKDEERELGELLQSTSDQDLRRDRLYLYFTQLGKCMYSGQRIELADLFDKNKYDIDHIYPQSMVKDDSLDNRVLVKKELNQAKTNVYPIAADIRNSQRPRWNNLLRHGLISKTKYDRLTRQTGFTNDEKTDFIARQLVETRQGTKAVAQLLKRLMPNTDIVYVKAGNVSDFRRDFKFLKVRELNDLHHAKDAYLNIVVGNVYDTKFTRSPAHFIRDFREPYNLHRMYDFPVVRGKAVAWQPGEDGTLATVRNTLRKNSVLVTQMAIIRSGAIADAQPVAAPNGQLPLKKGLPVEFYGGYNKVKGACFMLVEHDQKKKRVRSLVDVPIHLREQILENTQAAQAYCRDQLELQAPRIIIPVIRIKSLLSIDGFKMYLAGRTGIQLDMNCAHQLLLSTEMEAYLKRVLKYCASADEYERMHKGEIYRLVTADGITADTNLTLYDVFLSKLGSNPYVRMLSKQFGVMQAGRERFVALSCEKQCRALAQILKLFTRADKSADLTAIGGGSQAGTLRPQCRISHYKEVFILYQSATGLIEKKVDLLK